MSRFDSAAQRRSPVALRALTLCLAMAGLASSSTSFAAEQPPSLADLQRQLNELRNQYETRIQALESQLTQARQQAAVSTTAQEAFSPVATAPAAAAPASSNSFNPDIGVILSGTYASLKRDPNSWKTAGFIPGGEEVGPGSRGFNLGESEIRLSANIDPWFFGALTLSVGGDNTISAEEAFIQTTALPNGITVKAGRFFAGLGYLNEQHAHTWDFVDAPLVHQAFLGGQFKQEGLQTRWVLPTDQFVELGAEVGRGADFPGTDRNRNGAGSVVLSAHSGGDWDLSNSWRAGMSWMQSRAQDRQWDTTDLSGNDVTNAFTGTSRLWVVDGVWKWAPNGNAVYNNFKLQGEYFRRQEAGQVTYDVNATSNASAYNSAQSGWYLQGVWQFMPRWRVGLRHDQLYSGTVDYADNALYLSNTDTRPSRDSVMVDWSLSEFSRLRVQLSNDRSRSDGVTDRQLFLQYQMSLGAHGAHSY